MRFAFKDQHFEFPTADCVFFGILNVTPDSFFDGGRFDAPEEALRHALCLQEDGAHVIDVGGESTRPGAAVVSTSQEIARILPVIRILKKELGIPISIDTRKADVAGAALAEGAVIVNDISGLMADARMADVVASANAGLILTHSRGEPSTMQTHCNYRDVLEEVKRELCARYQLAISRKIAADRIAFDLGIGFAKTREQSLALLRNLQLFTQHPISPALPERPVMIGVSRKSFLGVGLDERAPGTLAAELWAYQQGARMIRTHDVGAIRRAIETFRAIRAGA